MPIRPNPVSNNEKSGKVVDGPISLFASHPTAANLIMLLMIVAGCALVPYLMTAVWFPAKPREPPSVLAEVLEERQRGPISFSIPILPRPRLRYFIILIFSYGCVQGVNAAWQGLMQQVFNPPLEEGTIAWLGFANQLANSVCAVICGWQCDVQFQRQGRRPYRVMATVSLVGLFLTAAVFSIGVGDVLY